MNDVTPSNYKVFINKTPVNYYVYALYDLEKKRVFYVGKGIGNRQYDHRKLTGGNIYKENYIESINFNYIELVLSHNLSHKEALSLEAEIINANFFELTNIINPVTHTRNKLNFQSDKEVELYLKKVEGYVTHEEFEYEKEEECEVNEITMEELRARHLYCRDYALEVFRGFYVTGKGAISVQNSMHLFPEIWG